MDHLTHDTNWPPPESPQQPLIYEAQVVPEPIYYMPPEPVRYFHRRVWRPLILFLLTCASTLIVGKLFYDWTWRSCFMYAVPLMTILICHEAGHFVQTVRHRVYASFPYFIPMPISPFGTMGAVIVMEARLGNRRALFDIGISGPLAGLVPTLIFSCLGLAWSTIGRHMNVAGQTSFGEPLIFSFLIKLILGTPPPGFEVFIHPVAFAGWVGLFLTALNLLPIGQFDGGHVLYALLRRKAHLVAWLVLVAAITAIAVGYYGYHRHELAGWMVMVFLVLIMGPRHPPTADDNMPLGTWRHVLGWLTMAFIPLGFTPIPITDGNQADDASITQRVDGGGNAAAVPHELGRGPGVADFHHGHRAEQAAEVDDLAGLGPGNGNQAAGGGFAGDHADGHFVGDDGGNGFGGRIAWNGDHVESHRTDAGHRL
jgi:Zn-dependent protease